MQNAGDRVGAVFLEHWGLIVTGATWSLANSIHLCHFGWAAWWV